jgi:multicomponent Na+:H+ antiporter subunit E
LDFFAMTRSPTYRNPIAAALVLMAVWALLNQTLSPEVLAAGLLPIGLILLIFRGFIARLDVPPLWRPRSAWALLKFAVLFLRELILSTLDVARRVIDPALPLRPAIVVFRLHLTRPGAQLLLANAITLTPGTLSVDLRGQDLYVHWLDHRDQYASADAKQAIAAQFERCLEEMYG